MRISIGIPFYNAGPYLTDAIRSVFAQTYQDWELILVDDGSNDGSLDIARSVRDPRVRVLFDGQNKRLPYRLNQISREARCDLVGRMDADDLISPTRFEKQISILEQNPDIDLVSAGVFSLSNDNRALGVRIAASNNLVSGRSLLLGRSGIVHAAVLGRKAWFLRNPYDQGMNLCEDYELWLRAFSKNDLKMHIVKEPLYYYREAGNVTARKMLTAYQAGPRLYRQYGHIGFSTTERYLYTVRHFCKSSIVRMLEATGNLRILLKNRILSIDPAHAEIAKREIEQILRTKVPGLD
jgi:glycosyltransferase involved in cell wall biosynthesis